MLMRIASILLASLVLTGCANWHPQTQPIPSDFIHLSQVAPTIRQKMRYAGTTNFMGRKVDGYQAGACIVTRDTAAGLMKAQEALNRQGFTLVMFDCYRPARAVADFMLWTQTPGPADPVWRPNVAKDRLVPDGYIAARSGHSRGSTVDLGFARMTPTPEDTAPRVSPCARADMTTQDFGTPFDCFDPASATAFAGISPSARTNRDTLLRAMTDAGFRNYSAEWWHFTLVAETNTTTIYDFPVTAAPPR
jgi:zinc D-Ala-D-Ala dipeptidase